MKRTLCLLIARTTALPQRLYCVGVRIFGAEFKSMDTITDDKGRACSIRTLSRPGRLSQALWKRLCAEDRVGGAKRPNVLLDRRRGHRLALHKAGSGECPIEAHP